MAAPITPPISTPLTTLPIDLLLPRARSEKSLTTEGIPETPRRDGVARRISWSCPARQRVLALAVSRQPERACSRCESDWESSLRCCTYSPFSACCSLEAGRARSEEHTSELQSQ